MEHTEDRPVGQFKRIVAKGSPNIRIRKSSNCSLRVAGSTKEAVDNVATHLLDGVLTIESVGCSVSVYGGSVTIIGNNNQIAGNQFFGNSNSANTGIATVYVEVPDLDALSLSGSSNVEYEGVDQDQLELKVSGAGDIEVSGVVNHLLARVSGAGNIDAQDLKARSVDLKVSGAGDIRAYASDTAFAKVSGAGDIKVYGAPKHQSKSVSGAGTIKFKE